MQKLVLRTKWLPYFVFGGLLIPLASLFLGLGIIRHDFEILKPAVVLLGILLFIYAYLYSFKVIIADGVLQVRNFYVWHKIPVSEIKEACIQTSMKTPLGERMTFRIWIEPHSGSGRKGFFIPIVNYKPEQLHMLYEILGIKNKRISLFSWKKN